MAHARIDPRMNPRMDRRVFERFREVIYDSAGIALGDHKDVLLAARLGKRMRALGIDEYHEYLDYVLGEESGTEHISMLDAVCTNVTSFFREANHFDVLAKHFAGWQAEGRTRFRFWSAACSTGEEVYSIAITLAEAAARPDLDVRILGTDISTKVLATAKAARYPEAKVDIGDRIVPSHFTYGKDGMLEVRPRLTQMATFQRLNLAKPPFPMSGPLDAVFCRNVMIYFDDPVRARLLGEIERLLAPGGLLFLGHAESLAGFETGLKPVVPSVFIKP